jgi:hypothetical protein
MGYSFSPSGRYGGGYSMGYPSYPSAGYGANYLMSYPSYSFGGYGGNYLQIPMPVNISVPVSTSSTDSSTSVQASGNSDAQQEFITELQKKYPDLEGIDWSNWQNWTDEDWQNLREALSAEANAKSLAQFKDDMINKWDAYDSSAWKEFNNNWDAFIVAAGADENDNTRLIWAGFVATYGCFDTSDPNVPNPDDVNCWQAYSSWTDQQWKNFRGLYNTYLDYEWQAFYQTLQSKLQNYNTVDWENWRDWTDADWEQCLSKINSGNATLVAGTITSTTPPIPIASPTVAYSAFGGFGTPGMGYAGAGWGAPTASFASWGGPSGGYGYYGSYGSGGGWGASMAPYVSWGGGPSFATFGRSGWGF